MLTTNAITDELVERLRTNPRGLNSEDQCVYVSREYVEFEKAAMCAIGFCLLPRHQRKIFDDEYIDQGMPISDLAQYLGNYTFDEVLQEQYRGKPVRFWKNLQALHDRPQYWEANNGGQTLTKDGIAYRTEIRGHDYA